MAVAGVAAIAALLVPVVLRILQERAGAVAAPRPLGPPEQGALLHRGIARQVAMIPVASVRAMPSLQRYELDSADGAVAFVGFAGIHVRSGDDYTLAIGPNHRPLTFTNHSRGSVWDLPASVATRLPTWVMPTSIVAATAATGALIAMMAARLLEPGVDWLVAELNRLFENPTWLAGWTDDAVRATGHALDWTTLALLVVGLAAALATVIPTLRRHATPVPLLMVRRAGGTAHPWMQVPVLASQHHPHGPRR